eukprot:2320256-Amphidinium_carterae.1
MLGLYCCIRVVDSLHRDFEAVHSDLAMVLFDCSVSGDARLETKDEDGAGPSKTHFVIHAHFTSNFELSLWTE